MPILIFKRIFVLYFVAVQNIFHRYRFVARGKKIRLTGPLRLRYFFEDCGGVIFKFGQILAMRFDILSASYAMALCELFENVSPVSNKEMFKVFRDEIGGGISTYFEIEPTPIATASFAQVYAGRYKGKKIVVKIQKPGTERYVKADLILLRTFIWLVTPFGLFRGVHIEEVVDQLVEWFKEELDYRCEAENTDKIYNHVRAHNLQEKIEVPRIYKEFTRPRVIVESFLEGLTVGRIIHDNSDDPKEEELIKSTLASYGSDLTEAGDAFCRELLRQYFIDGLIHADPHPGNLMIMPGNRIGFIDFGIIGKRTTTSNHFAKFVCGIVNHDLEMAANGMVQFGAERLRHDLGEENMNDPRLKNVMDSMLTYIQEHFREELKPIADKWHSKMGDSSASLAERSSYQALMHIHRTINAYGLRMPQDVIALNRCLSIIDMVCLRLSPEFNIVRAVRSFYDAFPLDVIENLGKIHAAELTGLHVLKSLERDPEEEKMREKERSMFAKEKIMHRMYAIAERNPELYTILKRYA